MTRDRICPGFHADIGPARQRADGELECVVTLTLTRWGLARIYLQLVGPAARGHSLRGVALCLRGAARAVIAGR